MCAPDDGWRYHPKHVEQFPDNINCVMLHLVGNINAVANSVISQLYFCFVALGTGRGFATTHGRTPLHERWAHRREFYLTTHNI